MKKELTIAQSIAETVKQAKAQLASTRKDEARLVAMIAALEGFEGGPTPAVHTKAKRLRAPKGALDNAILDSLKSGAKTNGELREHIKSGGYRYALTPELVRQRCQALKLAKPPQIKATGEGQGMKYALAK
jgi:hypothetical protein